MSPGRRDGLERRAHPRVPTAVEACYEDSGGQVFLRTADLSEGGLFLASSSPPPPGRFARVLLELPGQPAIQHFAGVVVRRRAEPGAGFALVFDRNRTPNSTISAVRQFVGSVGMSGAALDSGSPEPREE